VGPNLSNDRALADLLKSRHPVTLVDRLDHLFGSPLLQTMDVLVLECAAHVESALGFVRTLKDRLPQLVVVLINGGISQMQLATAFHQGIRDYFPANYDPSLLAERIENLALKQRRTKSTGGIWD
jgi:DNA-binding NtrC family response regulator